MHTLFDQDAGRAMADMREYKHFTKWSIEMSTFSLHPRRYGIPRLPHSSSNARIVFFCAEKTSRCSMHSRECVIPRLLHSSSVRGFVFCPNKQRCCLIRCVSNMPAEIPASCLARQNKIAGLFVFEIAHYQSGK